MNKIGFENELSDFIEASGLLEYDPVKISKIYKGHPIRLFKRLWQTLIPIGIYLLKVGIDYILGILNDKEKARKRAKEFSELLVKLGPAFIKAGQALSTRPDIIPGILLDELSELQDQLPGFDSKLAMACIKDDLNRSHKEIFEYLEEEPISAASLGQVHKGRLKSGEEVAVKIQRPGLREQITLDLYIVRSIAQWLNRNIKLIRSDLVALIDELGKRVFEEMDYLNEADNAIRFKNLHSHNKNIAIPKIYMNITSRRVLTMEWIEGVKLTDIEAVKALGIDREKMIDIGVNCSLQQLLEHGFFHADPHPGNLLALRDGRLCYLDFGMMSKITNESRTGLIEAVVHLVNKNFDRLSKDFVKLGFLSEEVDLKNIGPAFEKVFSQALSKGVDKLDFKNVTDDMSGVMYKLPFKVPPYYALIIRSLITLEGIALSVKPDFKILGAAYPYFARRLMEDPDPQLRQSLKDMLFDGGEFQWSRLDELVTSASNEQGLDLNIIIDQVCEFLFSDNGFLIRKKVVSALINKIDLIGINTIKKISTKIKIRKSKGTTKELEKREPIKETIKILQKIPGYKHGIFLNKIPKIIKEKNARIMGFQIAKGLAERNYQRFVRVTVSP